MGPSSLRVYQAPWRWATVSSAQLSLPTGLRLLCCVRPAVSTGTKVAGILNPIPHCPHVNRIGGLQKRLSSEGRTEMRGTGAYTLCKHSGPGLLLCEQAPL